MNYIRLGDFLTQSEMELAVKMWNESKRGYARRLHDTILLPNIARINQSLGQENDPMYLAYVVENVMGRAHD
jgi:hypothetical protein